MGVVHGFGAAIQYVQDEVDGCMQPEAQRIVLLAREAAPAAYGEAAHTASPSALPSAFRLALHTQAVGVLGE